jgi:hypothetical protein
LLWYCGHKSRKMRDCEKKEDRTALIFTWSEMENMKDMPGDEQQRRHNNSSSIYTRYLQTAHLDSYWIFVNYMHT